MRNISDLCFERSGVIALTVAPSGQANGIRTSNGTEDIDVNISGGTLNIAYNSTTSNYGTTGYVGLFA